MSKIGRKPILISSAKVEIQGNTVTITGAKNKFVHEFPKELTVVLSENKKNLLVNAQNDTRDSRVLWGLHRALLANKIKGVEEGFQTTIKIVGLGYKAQVSGRKMVFALGYSHKIEYIIPDGVDVEVDRSGQNLTVKSVDKFLVGNVCDAIRKLRLPEPYKGTGIFRKGESIIRKEGKTKGA